MKHSGQMWSDGLREPNVSGKPAEVGERRFHARRSTRTERLLSEQPLGGSKALIDWSESTVSVGARSVAFSRTEMRLLVALAERRGELITHAELIEFVWGADGERPRARAKALAVYICAIRKRLAALGITNAIRTLHGIGYVLGSADESSGTSMR